MKTCERCGNELPVHNGRHRPRKYCTDCRPSHQRKPLPSGPKVREIHPGASSSISLEASSRVALAAADVTDTPQGVLVMTIAKSIDGGGHSGASLAALSREYSRALADAIAASTKAADIGDGVEWGVG